MQTEEALLARRSVRAFRQDPIDPGLLTRICEIARLYPSGGNRQPIRMRIITDPALCREIFPHTRWAAYTKDYVLSPDQSPTAYILLAADASVSPDPQFDAGAAAASIMVLAKDRGLDSCCIGNFDRKEVARLLQIESQAYPLLYLIALGYSDQENRVEPLTDTVRYRYEEGSFIVPKYDLSDILF